LKLTLSTLVVKKNKNSLILQKATVNWKPHRLFYDPCTAIITDMKTESSDLIVANLETENLYQLTQVATS
jgi:hypothetical protein